MSSGPGGASENERPPAELAEFVERFNAGRYWESCEVLQEAWALNRSNAFYKGLIQLAGALDHLERGSLFWAEDLLASAYNILEPYAPRHLGLELSEALPHVVAWHEAVARARAAGARAVAASPPPLRLRLTGDGGP